MKKFILSLALCLTATVSAMAQGMYKNQVSASYGVGYQGILNIGINYSF